MNTETFISKEDLNKNIDLKILSLDELYQLFEDVIEEINLRKSRNK